MNDRELKYDLVAVDIYKTKRAFSPSLKKIINRRLLSLGTVAEVVQHVRNEYPNAYCISIYDGDIDFIGNY